VEFTRNRGAGNAGRAGCGVVPGEADPAGDAPVRLALLDWKRRVAELYRTVRESSDPMRAWAAWRAGRDELFRGHPQSPLPEGGRGAHGALPFYPYDSGARILAEVVAAAPVRYDIAASDGAAYAFTRFAHARFAVDGRPCALALYWLEGYGGGLFLPFRDGTSGGETYGGGRYLLDTVKGADLGTKDGRLVLDFNFAYNPSCAYDPRWSCPLSPPENRIGVAVRAGEQVWEPSRARPRPPLIRDGR
jgi:uncharacterized protein